MSRRVQHASDSAGLAGGRVSCFLCTGWYFQTACYLSVQPVGWVLLASRPRGKIAPKPILADITQLAA